MRGAALTCFAYFLLFLEKNNQQIDTNKIYFWNKGDNRWYCR